MIRKKYNNSSFFSVLKTILFIDLITGLIVTVKHALSKKITLEYPQQLAPRSIRFRGLHALRRYKNGQERCIGCKLCEAVCPGLAIQVEPIIDPTNNIRQAKKYEIDLFKCIYCGLCEESCPVDAIVQTNLDNYHFKSRGEQILNKQKLLEIGAQYELKISSNKEEDAAFC